MTFNASNNNTSAFPNPNFGAAGSGFGARGSRYNSKRLSVALPPDAAPLSENSVGAPTPRTSRSHLLAGLRTQPKTPGVSASTPYNQTQHSADGLAASQWADQAAYNGMSHAYQQGNNAQQQAAMRAGQQMYALPEQVLAPPSLYEQHEGMDPNLLQQLQMTSVFLAQRQQQLQQKLAALSVPEQINAAAFANPYDQAQASLAQHFQQQNYQIQQGMHGPQHVQGPIEVQPGVYLVYNPAIQGYSYVYDTSVQLANQSAMNQQVEQMAALSFQQSSTPVNERTRSFTPPKKSSTPPSNEHVEPLPPPSANAFRRGHKKASSLAINPALGVADGPKTSSAASFGSQRAVVPQPPMTGTFGPGSARTGEHPIRQPRGPPPLDELTGAPTSKHEGSKNFATRQRRRALDSLMRAGTQRRGVSRSSGGSPTSERDYNFTIHEDVLGEELASISSSAVGSRKMSPIGHEMKQKRGSQGSNDGYFGLSSASSSECEDIAFKQPPTPATPLDSAPVFGEQRKKMMMGVLNAAEKRKSTFM